MAKNEPKPETKPEQSKPAPVEPIGRLALKQRIAELEAENAGLRAQLKD